MKRTLSLLLAICLLCSLAAPFADAAATNAATVQQTVSALGIMAGDENGNMNLTQGVTRAQLAKMMIAASTYKDTISQTASSSPFKDVSYKYWGASYIKTAVTAGWIMGYTDGTYRPDDGVKLEEAVSSILKMLGYTTSDFAGAFPDAQLATYAALGLNSGISKTKGQCLTRQDTMYLFYNLMTTKTKSASDSKYYAATLGYTVNSNGEIDYNSLVQANMKGPFIVENSGWVSDLPFSTSNLTLYKNGVLSKLSAITDYDVYYYNAALRTVWVYRNQVTGVYTSATPNTAAPTAVTVAGSSYSVTTSAASFALSTNGSYKIGDTVTLLLGMNGDVVGVVSSENISATRYGVVTGMGTKTYSDAYGGSYTQDYVAMTCLDGSSYEFYKSNTYLKAGDVISVTYSGGDTSYSVLSGKSFSGTVNSTATAAGTYSFASDIQILDTTANGSYAAVYPSRLAGMALSASNVRWYQLDSDGKLSILILNDATGECYDYGVLTSASEKTGEDVDMSAIYKYIVNGKSGSYSTSSVIFGASWGPARFEFNGTDIVALRNLTGITLTSLTSQYGVKDGVQYKLGDKVPVYLYQNGSYSVSSLSVVLNGSYTLTGYYDGSLTSATRLRVIVAS